MKAEDSRSTQTNYLVSVNLCKIGAGCTIKEAGVVVHWQVRAGVLYQSIHLLALAMLLFIV